MSTLENRVLEMGPHLKSVSLDDLSHDAYAAFQDCARKLTSNSRPDVLENQPAQDRILARLLASDSQGKVEITSLIKAFAESLLERPLSVQLDCNHPNAWREAIGNRVCEIMPPGVR